MSSSIRTKMCLYLAGPLFSEAEREYNQRLKKQLLPFFNVYLPQEDGGLMVEMIAEGMRPEEAVNNVFAIDVDAIETCDLFLIILDGRSVDEGAAFELGFAYARGKPCYGLKTDFRQLLATGNNPMIDCGLNRVFSDLESLLDWARSQGLESEQSFKSGEFQPVSI